MRHQDFSLLANAAEEVANVLEQLATQHPDVFKSLGIRHPLADELGGYAFMLRDHVLTGEAPSAPSEPIAVQSPSGMAAVFESLGIHYPLADQQADPAPGQPRGLETEITAEAAAAQEQVQEKAGSWFALTSQGTVIALEGLHASFESADAALEKQGVDSVWLLDEFTARQWQTAIEARLPATADHSTPSAQAPAQAPPGQPRVLITVSGGVADYVCDPGVDVELFDFDVEKDDPTGTSKLPAHFSDLALSVGAAFEGDGHSEEEDSDLSAPAAPGGA